MVPVQVAEQDDPVEGPAVEQAPHLARTRAGVQQQGGRLAVMGDRDA